MDGAAISSKEGIVRYQKYKQRTKSVLSLKDRYQMYESEKNNPDPSMSREVWIKHLAKKLSI